MFGRFKKTTVEEVTAIQYTGDNLDEIRDFIKRGRVKKTLLTIEDKGEHFGEEGLEILTSGGYLNLGIGDWIAQGLKGDYYKCQGTTFEKYYEPISSNDFDAIDTGSEKVVVMERKCPLSCPCHDMPSESDEAKAGFPTSLM